MPDGTKNGSAWEKLFLKYNIVDKVNDAGCFEITSAQINEFRESRLMAKFDHLVNLPEIFRENQLSILPVSRYKYLIGRFNTHFKIPKMDAEVISIDSPAELESISHLNLYSESAALNFAYISGIIDDFINEKTFQTISGRMSTGRFSFQIQCKGNTSEFRSLSVDNSQCEIDAGFESENYLVIVEAKNYSVDDFLVRQLYYPFRLWMNKVTKKIVPILMTFSNDTFSFYEFAFLEAKEYTSISLVKLKKYIIEPELISLNDISSLLGKVRLRKEPERIPFPQADKFSRVVDLMGLLLDKDLTRSEITENYQFDVRQTQYYTDAGRYLGLIDKHKDIETKEVLFQLTDCGQQVLAQRHKRKYLSLIEIILSYQVFYDVFNQAIDSGTIPSLPEIAEIMAKNDLQLNRNTLMRRAGTVRRWIDWIWEQIEE